MDTKIVKRYLDKLGQFLGNNEEFMAVYNQMIKDPEVQHPEALGIGSEFVAPMPISTTKKVAFERILRRHKNLTTFKSKQNAISGRSAA
jgi:hypothetical protein